MSVDLIVFPLPTGRAGTTGRVSALFAPRLRNEAALSTYPDWVDWPSTLSTLSIGVEVDGSPVGSSVTSSTPSSALWAAIFPPDTPVEEHTFVDRRLTQLVGYKAGTLAASLDAALTALMVARPDGVSSYADLVSVPGLTDLVGAGLVEEVEAFGSTVGDTSGQRAKPTEPDFHGWLTLVAAHPALLRALGLVIDLQCNVGGPTPPSSVTVTTDYDGLPGGRNAAHLTMRTTASFMAESDPDPLRKEVEEGWLRCADDRYSFRQDGDAAMAAQLGQLQRQDGGAGDEPGTGGVPVRHGSGMVLQRNNTPDVVAARFQRQHEIELGIEDVLDGTEATFDLFAEDVVTGYRFDIWDDETGAWHSLYQRTAEGDYVLPRAASGVSFTPPPDEGVQVLTLSSEGNEARTIVQRSVGERQVLWDRRSGAMRASPQLITWYGWSKAATAPRRVFDGTTGEAVEVPANEPADEGVRLAITRTATPGTLPRLRYGWTYRIRGRAVDLAGNSLPPPPAGPTPPAVALSAPAPFGRSLMAPPTVLRNVEPPVPGVFEGPRSIVLHSDYDVDDATVAPDERMVFPPRTNQYTVELHALPAGGVDPASYALLAAREPARLEDEGTVVDGGELVWGSTGDGTFSAGPTDAVVPYLPEPATGSLCVAGAPGAAGSVVVPWDGTWPDLRAGRLVARAGAGAPTTRPSPDVLVELSVPKAVRCTLELSCGVDPDFLDHFSLWHLIPGGALGDGVRDRVGEGRHAMFSDRVAVDVVHAVRRPLAFPVPGPLGAERSEPGATDAVVVGPVEVDGASTGALVVRATWTETLDDPSDPDGPRPVPHAARARQDTPGGQDQVQAGHRLALATTKRAELSVELDAISAFVAYFLEQRDVALTNAGVTLDGRGVVASTVRVIRAGRQLTEGVQYELDAEAGTVARLPGGGLPPAAPVTVQYVARPVLRSSTEAGAAGTVTVVAPASVAPPPPEVLEVVPASTSRTRRSGQRIDVARTGAVVRVWLDRPWLASGDLERLAVVVAPGGGAGNDRSAIARDPGALAGGPSAPLTLATFPAAVAAVPDVDGTGDAVAVHEVRYDEQRQRWSADIELRGDLGYRPWVRLVLARYQGDAIDGAHLSPLVVAEPIRLGPERLVSVRRLGRRVGVRVIGPDHDGVPDGAGGSAFDEVVATVQVADPAIADPDLRWQDAGVSVTLPRVRAGRWEGLVDGAGALTGADEVRLVITETTPVPRHDATGIERTPVYVEVVDIPASWLPRSPSPAGDGD